jgi:hypothetical protein
LPVEIIIFLSEMNLMKRAVSISIGSSKRDKTVEVDLLDEHVSIERIGTDGSMEKAALLYQELDGKVDAFGVGGADLGLMVDNKWYPLYSVQPMVRYINQTPVVDGTGLKNTLENRIVPFMNGKIGEYIIEKKVMLTGGADRWGMTMSFIDGGYDCVFGDIMFALGLPFPLRSLTAVKNVAAIIMPIAGRLPFEWVYPTGEKQEKRIPKWEKYYSWASVIAGDCHYIKRHMPDRLDGKVVVTNTTTIEDVENFQKAGVKYLVTSSPALEGRSFGVNVIEAALVAVSGKGRKLTHAELSQMLDQLNMQPQLQVLN